MTTVSQTVMGKGGEEDFQHKEPKRGSNVGLWSQQCDPTNQPTDRPTFSQGLTLPLILSISSEHVAQLESGTLAACHNKYRGPNYPLNQQLSQIFLHSASVYSPGEMKARLPRYKAGEGGEGRVRICWFMGLTDELSQVKPERCLTLSYQMPIFKTATCDLPQTEHVFKLSQQTCCESIKINIYTVYIKNTPVNVYLYVFVLYSLAVVCSHYIWKWLFQKDPSDIQRLNS